MNIRLSALAALVLGTAASAADLDALRECAASRGYEITAVEEKPDYVKVAYVLRPTLESFIRCELAFPSGREWSGRFWGCGNGGPGGGVNVDVGIARRGDAVVHTDMGTSKGVYGRREVVRDFGWRSTHLMTVSAKELVTARFGRAPSKCYFVGGSTGGGQGFHEALRFPGDYDGILSYVPANTRIPLHVYFAWNLRLVKTADGKDVFTPAEFAAVEQAAIDWFADKDAPFARGRFLTDSRYDPATERAILALAKAKCPSLAEGDKLERLHRMFEGPVIGGKRVHAGVPFSGSFAGAVGNQWMLRWFLGPDRELHTVTDAELARWLEEWGPDCDACGGGIKAFAARGGRMIVVGGLEDSVVPYPSMIDWYGRAAEEAGSLEELEKCCRLYLLPGRAHGQGRGCGDIVDDRRILVDWVEKGIAPAEVRSQLRGGGEMTVKPCRSSSLRLCFQCE